MRGRQCVPARFGEGRYEIAVTVSAREHPFVSTLIHENDSHLRQRFVCRSKNRAAQLIYGRVSQVLISWQSLQRGRFGHQEPQSYLYVV